jgi:hypothetical protein
VSEIVVIRGAGDQEGPSIEDPYLTTTLAMIARGQHEIDDAADMDEVTLEAVFRSGLDVGQIVEVHDSSQGQTWIGKIVGISHAFTLAETISTLTIKRPRDY